MFKAKINNNSYDVKFEKSEAFLNEEIFDWDITKTGDRGYHIISNNKSYRAEIINIDTQLKTVLIKINGKKIEVALKDKFDLLLEKLGMDTVETAKVNDIKAPMPGLIIEIQIKEGDEVKKGDPIMILEAMKMENILKSPGDGLVRSIKVKKGDSVEKNQVLVLF
jgi:acetyl/propionyl-CoA carboxylase alpha subunit